MKMSERKEIERLAEIHKALGNKSELKTLAHWWAITEDDEPENSTETKIGGDKNVVND
jgi:hypothetical protein